MPSNLSIAKSLHTLLSIYKKDASIDRIQTTFEETSFLSLESRIEFVLMQNNLKCYWAELSPDDFKFFEVPFFIKVVSTSNEYLDLSHDQDEAFIYFKEHKIALSSEQKYYGLIVQDAGPLVPKEKRPPFDKLFQNVFLLPSFIFIFSIAQIGTVGHWAWGLFHAFFYALSTILVLLIYRTSNAGSTGWFCRGDGDSCQSILNSNPFGTHRLLRPRMLITAMLGLHGLVILAFPHIPLFHSILIGISLIAIAWLILFQFRRQTFCRLCMVLSVCLVALFFSYWNFRLVYYPLSFIAAVQYIGLASLAMIAAIYVEKNYELETDNKRLNQKNQSFLLDARLFKGMLQQQINIDLTSAKLYKQTIRTASENITVDLIISLRCPHCYQVLKTYIQLIEYYDQLGLNLWIDPKQGFTHEEEKLLEAIEQIIDTGNLSMLLERYEKWFLHEMETITPKTILQQEIKSFRTPSVLINRSLVPGFYSLDALKFNLSVYLS